MRVGSKTMTENKTEGLLQGRPIKDRESLKNGWILLAGEVGWILSNKDSFYHPVYYPKMHKFL